MEPYGDKDIYREMKTLMSTLRQTKPEERNEKARRYAVTITEFEKVMAYFKTFVIEEN